MLHDALNVFDQAGGGGRRIARPAIAGGALVRARVALCAMVSWALPHHRGSSEEIDGFSWLGIHLLSVRLEDGMVSALE
jgi:hypothetical protein